MSSNSTAYTGLQADERGVFGSKNDQQLPSWSTNMMFPKAAYVGVALDDIDTVDVDVRSVQTRFSQTSGFSRSSQTSYLSNVSLLRTRMKAQASIAASSLKAQIRQLFTVSFWRTLPSQTKTWWQEVWSDAKTLRLGHQFYRIFNFTGPLVVIILLCMVLKIITRKDLYPVDEACRPDAGFYVGDTEYNIFASTGFFQITLAFGTLPFSTAKIIDVAWDVVVGRGGQGILVAICFLVYGKALVRSMESTSVSYGTYEAITLQSGSITGSLKLARDLFKNPTMRAKFLIFWIIISALFVLLFPTMASAMSGYAANIDAYIATDDGNMIPYSKFHLIRYIIHDAHRLGDDFGKDHKVATGSKQPTEVADVTYSADECITPYYPYQTYSDDLLDWSPTEGVPACEFYWHVSEYAFNYGFLGTNQTNSTFNNSGTIISLDPPSLDISAIFWKESWLDYSRNDEWWEYPYGYEWKAENGSQPFKRIQNASLTDGEYTFTLEELNQRGQCQQSNTSYKWGFSFLILFSVLVGFVVWCVGMYVLWVDAFLNSRVDNAGRHIGLQRAVLDLASVMKNDIGDNLSEMASNNHLNKKVRNDLKGGRIDYQMLTQEHLPMSRWNQAFRNRRGRTKREAILIWAKADWKWLTFFLLSAVFLIVAVCGSHAPVLTPIFFCYGSAAGLYVGPTHKGRWLLFLICLAIGIAMGPIGPYVYLSKSHYALVWLSTDPYYAIWWWYG
ncbi:hypothetical protein LTR84_009776 [Exophiala bonariae]|uniref:Uncharacterized protein n=1 Tax=Exophiala bonariae TaxID=1690606 RepID=A0AAV9NLP9_9EURO|nr:hypothetical protein LTR84_009776 [Exophiala bonariae]